MTGLVELVALLALGALLGWVVGSFALRLGGAVIVLVGLIALAFEREIAAGLVAIVLGSVAWLAGHWLYAFRHHGYRNPLAERIFLQVLPRGLDPTRGWSVSAEGPSTPTPTVRVEIAAQPALRSAPGDQRHTVRRRRG